MFYMFQELGLCRKELFEAYYVWWFFKLISKSGIFLDKGWNLFFQYPWVWGQFWIQLQMLIEELISLLTVNNSEKIKFSNLNVPQFLQSGDLDYLINSFIWKTFQMLSGAVFQICNSIFQNILPWSNLFLQDFWVVFLVLRQHQPFSEICVTFLVGSWQVKKRTQTKCTLPWSLIIFSKGR